MKPEETAEFVLNGLEVRKKAGSRDLHEILFEYAPDAYYLNDTQGRFITGNRAAEALIGFRREELVGKSFIKLDLLSGGQVGKALKLLAMNVLKKPTGPDEFELKRKDGSQVFVEIRTYPATIEGKTVVLGIAREITERRLAKERLEQDVQKLQKSRNSIIQAMASIIDMRDPYTAGHHRRVAHLAGAIAVEMRLSLDRIETIKVAALIHDLGKIAVPAEILNKPGRLDREEMDLIREHPAKGFNMLAPVELLGPVAEIIHQHHERLDGSGYPRGLSGAEVLPEARILSVAEAVDAMLSHRPYRPALTLQNALDEFRRDAGVRYDARVIEACLTLFEKKNFNPENGTFSS